MTKPKSKPKAATRSIARKTAKSRLAQAAGTCIVQDKSGARYQARSHHCDAADTCRGNHRGDHDGY